MFGPSVVGIDMGTANTLVYAKEKGILSNGSSVIAVDARNKHVLAFGDRAKEMLGKTPEHIIAMRPIQDGAVSDFYMAVAMLKSFLQQAKQKIKTFVPSKLNVVICVPADINRLQKKAIEDAAIASGAVHVRVVESVLAAAMGAGLPVWEASGHAVLDIGGGTTEAAVISLGGIVTSLSIHSAGNAMDACIQNFMKRRHQLIIGEHTAERVKIQIGSAVKQHPAVTMRVSGQDAVSGFPKWLNVSSDEIYEALKGSLSPIRDALTRTLENSPPEIVSDMMHNGILLTGGGALLHQMDTFIANATGLPVRMAVSPLESTAIGACKAADQLRLFDKTSAARSREIRNVGS
jgi:rod shape-determining protein MreB